MGMKRWRFGTRSSSSLRRLSKHLWPVVKVRTVRSVHLGGVGTTAFSEKLVACARHLLATQPSSIPRQIIIIGTAPITRNGNVYTIAQANVDRTGTMVVILDATTNSI